MHVFFVHVTAGRATLKLSSFYSLRTAKRMLKMKMGGLHYTWLVRKFIGLRIVHYVNILEVVCKREVLNAEDEGGRTPLHLDCS